MKRPSASSSKLANGVLQAFSASLDAVIQLAADSEWGRRAVIVDSDRHRIELLQA
jgi:hypothetical protein